MNDFNTVLKIKHENRSKKGNYEFEAALSVMKAFLSCFYDRTWDENLLMKLNTLLS